MSTITLIINPIGDRDLDMVNEVGDLNISPMILLQPIDKNINKSLLKILPIQKKPIDTHL